ncbi:MAG TPA: glycosyltransferase family 4 protein [Phycisphaerae bacterium]|nr:glycosyltransferase family 4 protein [Phycisphaerae bacterium]HNU46321.1 glycosyltransferase family 4 protein [Phycisphaerae bacterium]
MGSLLATHTSHFVRGPDGHVYSPETLLGYAFWTRYLVVFEGVSVVARVARRASVPGDLPRADGPGVEFLDLPDYLGPWEYLARRAGLGARVRAAVGQHDAYCLRVPCANATLIWHELRRRGLPFGLEVVGDPADSLGAGAVRSLARPLARWSAVRALRAQCRTACATAYVTREMLQRHYPPAPGAFTTHYSSIELPPEAFVVEPRTNLGAGHRLVYVGTLEVLYKAPDVLIRALALCRPHEVRLTIVGEGRERAGLEALARDVGVRDRITFAGRLPAGAAVREVLDTADLFVLPSRQEGLPRAMIEAMARGLPCLGSTVGGIPELLPAEDMVRPGDAKVLAAKITEMLADNDRLCACARRNLALAQEYVQEALAQRRRVFYQALDQASARCGAARAAQGDRG